MKRIGVATIIVSLIMALGLSSCGNDASGEDVEKETTFQMSIYEGDIVVDGTIPNGFKVYSKSDEEAAAATAKEKGEEYTPEYEFTVASGDYVMVGPENELEFSTLLIEPDFAGYMESCGTSSVYPILKRDFKIDGREAFIVKNSSNAFNILVDIGDYNTSLCYSIFVSMSEDKSFASDEEMIRFIEEDANLNAILDSLKFTIK